MTPPLEPYVVIVELAWNNGVLITQVDAIGPAEAQDTAYYELLDAYGANYHYDNDYLDIDGDGEGDDEGDVRFDREGNYIWKGDLCPRHVRATTVVRGTLC